MSILGLLSLAFAPGLAIVLYVYLKDIHEREPLGLLFISFLYGCASVFITLTLSWPLDALMSLRADDVVHQFANAFFKVAFVEELSKFIFIRFILYYNKNFNEPYDGILYAGMVGMDFATLENIVYVFQYGVSTGIMRMFTAVPAHATFAILMGYFLGKAKFIHRKEILYSVSALAIATLFHGAYDYFLFISFVPGIWLGAIASLIIALILSRKAIQLHQQSSPFLSPTQHKDKPDSPESETK